MYKTFIPFLLVFISFNSYSQAKASASASATIVSSSVGIAAFADTTSTTLEINNQGTASTNSATGNRASAIKIKNSTNGAASFNLVGANEAFDITFSPGYTIRSTASVNENISLRSFTISQADNTGAAVAIPAAPDRSGSTNGGTVIANAPLTVIVNFN